MKIAQIAPAWITIPPKNYGGTEAVIYYLVEELVAQGHEVTLLASGDARTAAKQVSFVPRGLLEEGVPWQESRKAYYHLYKAIEYVKGQPFDIVHTHLSSLTDMFLFPLQAGLQRPHVSTLHSHLPFQKPRRGDDSYELYMEWAPMVPVVAISESARDQQQETMGLNIVDVVYHGLPMGQYCPVDKRHDAYFVWLGRFSPEKGAHLAIEAAKKAQVRLVLAGTIDRSSRKTMAYFHEMIEPQVDKKQIRYLGPVDTKRKIRLMSRAQGFLNPIEWEEPFGMVMIEAMAVGCPVISFRRGAASEIIVDGETGFLVKDVDEMVDRMERIDEIDRKATRRHAEQHFAAAQMARHYVEVYQKVIEQVGSSASTS